ncbi:MAG: GNAT family N-acetyltransferase [Thermomicrobia bacterium]|nr:GNAT family N-acetyltransferase [Thermomicrobia bacterium]
MSARLLPCTRESPFLDDAVHLFVRTWPGYDLAAARASFLRCTGQRDFRGIVAISDGAVVGFGFGARSSPGSRWHDQMMAQLGDDHPALRDAWRLVELAVAEEHRGRGIGGRVHDALLAVQPCPRALLCTYTTNARARAMYERRGWRYLHSAFIFPPDPHAYANMAKELVRVPPKTERRSSVPAEEGSR